MSLPKIDCKTAQEWIITAQDIPETLDNADKLLLEAHLAECNRCQTYQAAIRNLIGSIQDIERVSAPSELTNKVLACIQPQQPAAIKSAIPLQKLQKYVPLVAAAFFVVMAISLLLPSNPQPGSNVAQSNPETMPAEPVPYEQPQYSQPQEFQPVSENTGPSPQNHAFAPSMSNDGPEQNTPRSQPRPEGTGSPSMQGEMLATSMEQDIFSAEEQSDIYYDPLTDVVGF